MRLLAVAVSNKKKLPSYLAAIIWIPSHVVVPERAPDGVVEADDEQVEIAGVPDTAAICWLVHSIPNPRIISRQRKICRLIISLEWATSSPRRSPTRS